MELKKTLRHQYLQKRKELIDEDINISSKKISNLFIAQFVTKGHTFHIFKSMSKFNEIKTSFIINELFNYNKKIVLPKMNNKKLISCEIVKNQTYKKNRFGVEEPCPCKEIEHKNIDVVIVPLLICDKNGNRIGYGGGYYDRFLQPLNAIKVGINFFKPINTILTAEAHDIPLDYLVTPENIYKF